MGRNHKEGKLRFADKRSELTMMWKKKLMYLKKLYIYMKQPVNSKSMDMKEIKIFMFLF